MREREKSEFDLALRTVDESLEMVQEGGEENEKIIFYKERMGAMQSLFKTLDNLVSTLLALENLVSLSTLKNLLDKEERK